MLGALRTRIAAALFAVAVALSPFAAFAVVHSWQAYDGNNAVLITVGTTTASTLIIPAAYTNADNTLRVRSYGTGTVYFCFGSTAAITATVPSTTAASGCQGINASVAPEYMTIPHGYTYVAVISAATGNQLEITVGFWPN